jgi:hypothetical protein
VLQLSLIAVPKAVTTIMPQFFHQDRHGKIVILNLFQDNKLPLLVILKQVQDDEGRLFRMTSGSWLRMTGLF